ncbi:MAG: C13 family peptidase [Bacteroides sp.]|nr:C13 family peptidase [Bacteroides sp.]
MFISLFSLSKRCLMLLLLIVLCFAACKDDDLIPSSSDNTADIEETTIKIAVILPRDTLWERTIAWAQTNLALANAFVQPEIEWYDETTIDVESVASELANRDDIACIIGCETFENTQTVAYKCAKTYKPMFTFCSSADLARAFAQRGFYWGLRESDITQCEMLLSLAALEGAQKVSLIATDDLYGQTFVDWFAFQATELGMTPTSVATFSSVDESVQAFKEAYETGCDYIIVVPSGPEEVLAISESGEYWNSLYADKAATTATLGEGGYVNFEGVAASADPSSGFSIAYKAHYGELPVPGEAELYDAVMIACLAAAYQQMHTDLDMNDAIGTLLNTEATSQGGWIAGNMRLYFEEIAAGGTPAISGATGLLDFSSSNYTTIQYSTYTHWMYYFGAMANLDYLSRRSSDRTSSYLAGWEWNNSKSQTFDENQTDATYTTLTGNWAVVIAASSTWTNYRHQADALEFYQMLRAQGYDDDHIILIMADDLAYNEKNPNPGVVCRTLDGDNLYVDVRIDYDLNDLTLEDLNIILSGTADADHPVVLGSGSGDNVLFFWSGHGTTSGLVWNDTGEYVTGEMLNRIFTRLSDEDRFRKMLCITETCYSGGVAEKCEGIPGILFLTAANGQETSKADVLSEDLGVWMTNRFSSVLLEYLEANPSRTLRELYLETFNKTLGSHVMMYNSANYGNVYLNRTDEYLAIN